MFGLGFLNPLLLWALPAASIPIIIHLLNRRRFNKVRWAAMEYLLAALKRNRRRLRMEQWLVLLLRTLAIMLLVLLVTRPQLTGSVLGDVRTHHIVCLDDSASMAHRAGATTAFKSALDYIRGLADKLAETRSGDLFTVLRASRATAPDTLGTRVGPQLKSRARDLLSEIQVGDGVMDVAEMLAEVDKRVAAAPEASRAEIYIVTDLRKRDWLNEEGKPRAAVQKQIAGLDSELQHLTLVGVGPKDNENLAIVDLRRAGRLAASGVPCDITVEVKNHGFNASRPAEVALTVDGASQVVRAVEALEPGESRRMTFTHTFREAGFHGVLAALPRDRYGPDDSRALSVEVVESSRVLLVDGDPGERSEEAETYFLATALQHEESGLAVEVIPDHALGDYDLAEVDMIYLANVPVPETAVVEKLEQFVESGGGLVVFLGNQIDPARYNELLYKEGAGLLPVRLTDFAGDLDRPEAVTITEPDHGTMVVATETLQLVFSRMVQIGRYVGVEEAAEAKVVLRVGSASGDPLMLTHHFRSGGEVMLVTTTADIHWNSWPKSPAYLITVQQMHRVAARVHDQSAFNLGPAGHLHLQLDPARYRPDVAVRGLRDDGGQSTFTARASKDANRDIEALVDIPMSELRGVGLFEVALTPHVGDREMRMLARNTPVEEGELQKLTQATWRSTYPDELQDRVSVVDGESAKGAVLKAGYGEVWRGMALAMLAALMIESLLAWRFGRR